MLAWQMIRAAYKCSSDLQSLMRALKADCPVGEYEGHARAIAASIASLNLNVVERALEAHPELRKKIELDIASHGRLME
jgi:hypothetical protein